MVLNVSERDGPHSTDSSRREKVVEHLFIGELLRYLWVARATKIDVLKSEVDNSGYDIVVVNGAIVRHIQLKTSLKTGRAAKQSVNLSLASQQSGCVIWIIVDDDLNLKSFLWFGGEPGLPLPSMASFKPAKHTKANSLGVKSERPNIRSIPKGKFEPVADVAILVKKLFG